MILFKKEIKFEKIVWVSIKCCIFACMEQVSGFYFPPLETNSAQFSNMTEISASGFNPHCSHSLCNSLISNIRIF